MENYKKFYNVHMKSKLDFLLALVFLICAFTSLYYYFAGHYLLTVDFQFFYKADRGGYKGVPFKIFKISFDGKKCR